MLLTWEVLSAQSFTLYMENFNLNLRYYMLIMTRTKSRTLMKMMTTKTMMVMMTMVTVVMIVIFMI